jgi:hypothetical protein
MKQYIAIILSAIIVATVTVLMVGSAATATIFEDPLTDTGQRKVWVCKYVGTPGASERLQTGQNPINVSRNSIKVPVVLGAVFPDAHGRSIVIGFGTSWGQRNEPSIEDCPPPPPPPPPCVNCTPPIIPPPPIIDGPDIFYPRAKVQVCGDPRLLITISNKHSTVPLRAVFRYEAANGGERRIVVRVKPGQVKVLAPRWVVGESTLTYVYRGPQGQGIIGTYDLPPATGWGKSFNPEWSDGPLYTCPNSLRQAKRIARRN